MTPLDTETETPKTSENTTSSLRFRVAAALMGGVELCYDPELARAFALAYIAGGEDLIEADSFEAKLKDKYGDDFNLPRFRRAVKAIQSKIIQGASPQREDGWQSELIRKPSKDGGLGPLELCEANALLYFENHPDWQGVLGYNQFTAQHAILRHPPDLVHLKPGDSLEDHHDTQFARWMQTETRQPWKVEMVRRVVDCHAKEHSFHPVRDYLNGLPEWDHVPRLKSWLFDYAGAGPASDADDSHDPELLNFIAAAGERWMISAVARIHNPGCEVHHMLVLEGGEGLGKSMLVKKIGKGWSQVMQGALDGRSAQELIASAVWIWEFAELASLKKTSEVESAKAFITNPEETFRPAYGHRVIKHKRECAFIATVNNDQYFDSQAWEDGKRRAWPIRCTRPFDLDGLDKTIDLLWAEADYKFKHGFRWHFDRNEDSGLITTAIQEQALRVPEHVLTKQVTDAAAKIAESQQAAILYGSASIPEILAELNIPLDRRRSMQQDVGRCLRSAGWMLFQPRHQGKQVRRYRPAEMQSTLPLA